ncbi:AsmA-like C-terminal domain-containing protein [Polymorphum gilvum]|uniref:DUF3971 domain-containing protein n=1 Tax=Polymorphum gilvum (strain LMG 25793 / CGMCC 1.9160 / SL003B-26A1) TaxID=991905 RepID=F2IXX9_POLGS|nr:AsmA-like C-terminal domain-containing protein [Polymorphum gilvum]ADZ70482.1 hypothetical protein SL003B_2056 [Polymorphum gilvum SL003B-26A1]
MNGTTRIRSPRPSGSRRRRLVLVLLAVALVGVAAAAYRLASGAIVAPLLADLMEERASNGPTRLTIGSVSIDLFADDGVQVVISDAHLRVEGAAPVDLFLPRIEAPVQIAPLWSGVIRFATLAVDRPRLVLGMAGSPDEIPDMAHVMEAIDRVAAVVVAEFDRRALADVTIANGRIDIEGAVPRRLTGIDAEIRRDAREGLIAEAEVAGRMGTWNLVMRRTLVSENGARHIGLVARDLTLAELFSSDESVVAGRGFGLPMQVRFNANLSDTGKFEAANLVGRSVNGWFQMGPTTIQFDDVALSLSWIEGTPGILVSKSHVIRGNTHLFFSGNLMPPQTGETAWHLALMSDQAQFGSGDVPEPPQQVDVIQAEAHLDPQSRMIFVDRFALQAGPSSLQGVGSVELRGDGPYVALAFNAADVGVSLLKQVWPITLTPPARRWIIDHMRGGRIDAGQIDVAIRPPAFDVSHPDPGWSGDDLKMDLRMADVSVAPLGSLPTIEGLTATVSIDNEVLTIAARGGQARLASGNAVNVPEATFRIEQLRERNDKVGVLDVKLDGAAADLGAIVDSKPFQVLERTGLSAQALSGSGEMRVDARFPLRLSVDLDAVAWSAQAVLDDFSSKDPIKGHLVRDADVTVVADPSKVTIKGNGRLDGLKADIDIQMPLGGSDVAARQGVVLKVTAKELAERGIDLSSLVKGPMVLELSDAEGHQRFDIDLTDAAVTLEPLGWEKAPGVLSRASFLLVTGSGDRVLRDFRLQSDGVDVAGSVTLSATGEFREASFDRFQIRPGDTASLKVGRDNGGRYRMVLKGRDFDGRGLIARLRDQSRSENEAALSAGYVVTAQIDRLQGFGGVVATGFAATIEGNGVGVKNAVIAGQTNNRSTFQFRIESQNGARTATAELADTGAILRFLDLYERMRGGRGQLSVAMPSGDEWVGSITVRDLSIAEDPAIRKLSEIQAATGGRDGRPILNAGSVRNGEASFDTMQIVFDRRGDMLTVQRGTLQGAVVGGTIGGTVNLASRSLALTGTFVPIFALNNLFAKIPLLGFALGGGSEEGLIGVTYRLSGPMNDPVLSVNPVSAIAPGIFRKMFEFR